MKSLGVDVLCDWGKLQEVSLEGRGKSSGISRLGRAVLPSVWGKCQSPVGSSTPRVKTKP